MNKYYFFANNKTNHLRGTIHSLDREDVQKRIHQALDAFGWEKENRLIHFSKNYNDIKDYEEEV